ncbi:porin [Oxalobacter aliiformigenes]|uniref:Porin n=1 Tax=Oxalobacter aliiformigenes TaxID=2946593 RepID=A0ABY7JFY6_9BURK|nr:porin [Oxalobacter aliiformigenes]WAV92838.1 porin [Oxalobacter aliiformigenes]WAV95657.1 porin [Oxalobacter aliiformigenes]WAV96548.1 porin [Oxalobacter aliiformigenes]
MKKTFVALSVFGLFAGVAQAQSNVTIYGVLDVGYVKETGRDLRMGDYDNNRIGFRGTEDLGSGYKAIFDIQRRFDLSDGTLGNSNTASYKGSKSATQKDWDGAAWLGLAGPFGQVRLGRINQIETEFIRKFDPFNQIGVGSQFYGLQRNARIDNTLRYDSPKFNGLGVSASYSLGANTNSDSITDTVKTNLKSKNADNDGYELGVLYDSGSFSATANWSRVADSNDSSIWSVGLGYRLTDAVKVSLSYEDTDSKGWKGGNSSYAEGINTLYGRQRNLLAGLVWNVGPGRLNASVQWDRLSNTKGDTGWTGTKDAYRYAVGYTYDLSKRTSLYGNVAYTDYDDKDLGYRFTGLKKDSVTGVQAGITHKF